MLVDGGCNQDQPRPTSMGVMMLVGYTFRLTTITTTIVERQTKTNIERTRATKTSEKQKRIYEETRPNTRRHRSGLRGKVGGLETFRLGTVKRMSFSSRR